MNIDNVEFQEVNTFHISDKQEGTYAITTNNQADVNLFPLDNLASKEYVDNKDDSFKGYHTSISALNVAYPPAKNKKDWFAWCGAPYPGTVYKVSANGGSWTNTGQTPNQAQVNLVDYTKLSVFNSHQDNKKIHFNEAENPTQSIDNYTSAGVYRGVEDGLLIVYSDLLRGVNQVYISSKGVQTRRTAGNVEPFPAWSAWSLAPGLATADKAGLMSIDHFKSVEDMVTNFEGLINSQTEIKNAIADLSQRLGHSEESWDSYFSVTVNKKEGVNTRINKTGHFSSGSNKISKVVGENESFVIKGDDIPQHSAPIVVNNSKENVVQMYNNGATSIGFAEPKISDVYKRFVAVSTKVDYISVAWSWFEEIDVTRCPKLRVLNQVGNGFSTLDLGNNILLEELSLGEGRSLTALDVSRNVLLKAINLYLCKKLVTLNMSGCTKLGTVDISSCTLLKLSGVTFPATYRPSVMNIKNSGFTYADIIDMVTNKWTSGATTSTIQVSLDMYNTIMSGDKTPFQNKNVTVVSV